MMNYGFQDAIRALDEYILGENKLPTIPYVEDGNWQPYLPKYENQTTKLGDETSGCTVWGTQNCIETFMKRLYGDEPNYSERFTYLNVPIEPTRGANPHVTCETIRKYGLVNERDMPMTSSIAEYLNRDELTDTLYDKGARWLEKHDFKHEWLWTTKPSNYIEVLQNALKTTPIGVSVSAWNEENGVYVSYGDVNNHWCMLFKIDAEGYPWVFDSYDHTIKKLAKDHNIRRAKRFWINRRVKKDMRRHIKILKAIIDTLMLFQNKKTLTQLCEDAIGTDVTPDDMIPDSVACAITVSTLINKLDATFPKVAGTWTLWDILEHRDDYERVTVPSPETIVISPTGTGNGSISGHTGILLTDNVIASNDSATGKFLKNYTLDTWRERYVNKGGMKIYMYKRKV